MDTMTATDTIRAWHKFSRAIAKAIGVWTLTGLDRAMAKADFEAGLTVDECLAKRRPQLDA